MMQMEKIVQQQRQRDMELMKTAMLKHKETFRQQVHDLHRLYRIQKLLMSDLMLPCPSTLMLPWQQGRRRRQHRRWSELPVDEHVVSGRAVTGLQVTPPPRGSEDELELTLAVGSGGGRGQRKRRQSSPSSSTDSSGAEQRHQRATACDLREGVMAKQPQ